MLLSFLRSDAAAARRSVMALIGLALAAPIAAFADVIPPYSIEAERRMAHNPTAVDRVDAFCRGRAPGSACQIPGTRFEGGGAGVCTRYVARGRPTIDMACKLSQPYPPPELPATPFRAPGYMCPDPGQTLPPGVRAPVEERSNGRFVCGPVPEARDTLCRDLKPGDACTVVDTVGDRTERSTGVCVAANETAGVQGERSRDRGVRPTVTCRPKRTVETEWTEIGVIDKLRQ